MKNQNNINFKLYKHATKSKTAGHNVYSLRDKEKVIKHVSCIHLKNCVFHINERGRRRVIESGVKNVHAYINAENYDYDIPNMPDLIKVVYNPFKFNNFIALSDNRSQPIFHAEDVYCMHDGVYVIGVS